MMLGARVGAWAKAGYAAKDYVQNGLVAMWDGIENARWGKHSAIKSCVDLKGLNGSIINYYSQEQNSFWLKANSLPVEIGERLLSAIASGTFTFESYIDVVDNKDWGYILSSLYSSDWRKFSVRYNNSASIIASNKTLNGYLGTIKIGKNRLSFASLVKGDGVIYENDLKKTFADMTSTDLISDRKLYFGNLRGYSRYSCNCKVHSIRFYDRRLSDDEIAANYAIDKARFNLP